MLRQRLLTAAVLVPAVLAALFLLPGAAFALVSTCVLLAGAWEWGGLAAYRPLPRALYALVLWGSGVLLALLPGGLAGEPARSLVVLSGALAAVFWMVLVPAWLGTLREVRHPLVLAAAGAVTLLPLWLACAWLQKDPRLLLSTMAVVWVSDTAAYFAGRRFGRARLVPRISPGKTWAGLWGALLAVLAYCLALRLLPASAGAVSGPGVGLGLVLAVLGVEGDLFESWLKRVRGVKDSGRLLPGHGGILDRIDALTASVPVAALYYAVVHPVP